AGLRRDDQRLGRRAEVGDGRRMGNKLTERHARDAQPAVADHAGGVFVGDDSHGRPGAVERGSDEATDAARPEHGDHGSISTPGFSTPAGSTAALAARSALANGSGRWRSYQGRWS